MTSRDSRPAPPEEDPVDAAMARWQPAGPSPDFAERVLAARRAAPSAPAALPRRGWPLWTAIGTAVAVVALLLGWPTRAPVTASSAVTAVGRRSIALGGRGVAVAEDGAVLRWQRVGSSASVTQDRGDVFYRVDPGGPFTVHTPAGEVRVTGTCFRVEVPSMKSWMKSLVGAAAGAAVSTAVVVTLYEGNVLVVSPAGSAPLAPGERAVLIAGQAPQVQPAAGPEVRIDLPDDPPATITREQLLARDRAQREQLAQLATRIRQLETDPRPVVKKHGGLGGGESWVDPTQDELLAFAKDCRVQIDLPPVMRGTPMRISPETARAVGLDDAQLAEANQVFVELAADWRNRVRAWYIEGTGDAQGADQLSAEGMGQELQDKAAEGEADALQRRISHERAGLMAPPGPNAKLSAFERYFRALADLGNEAERWLAAKIGRDQAHAVRANSGGWPMRMAMAGCPDGSGDGAAPPAPR